MLKIIDQPMQCFLGLACLIVLSVALCYLSASEAADCPEVTAELEFDSRQEKDAAEVDAGFGVSLRFSSLPRSRNAQTFSDSERILDVYDRGRKVVGLPGFLYSGFTRLTNGRIIIWAVSSYTGGAHCCTVLHFFRKEGPKAPLAFLGRTEGSMGSEEQPYTCIGSDIYFEDLDIRFGYFHTSHAESILHIPTFYRLGSKALEVENTRFKDRYQREVKDLDAEIGAVLNERKTQAESLLAGENAFFSDSLGQLLMKRTLLGIYAREDQAAWRNLKSDVMKHYRTNRGIELLKQEVSKILQERPY